MPNAPSTYRSRDFSVFLDITIFDREVQKLIGLPYPKHETTGPILPSGIAAWCERRGLQWECECARTEDHICPVRFTGMQRTVAMCYSEPPRCGLKLDFKILVLTATKYSSYPHIKTLAAIENEFNKDVIHFTPSQTLVSSIGPIRYRHTNTFHSYRLNPLMKPLNHARKRRSLITWPDSSLPGNQLALPTYIERSITSPSPSAKSTSSQRSTSSSSSSTSSGTKSTSSSSSARSSCSSPSPSPSPSASTARSSKKVVLPGTGVAIDALAFAAIPEPIQRLLEGLGISDYEHLELVDKCNICSKNFLPELLISHKIVCSKLFEDAIFQV